MPVCGKGDKARPDQTRNATIRFLSQAKRITAFQSRMESRNTGSLWDVGINPGVPLSLLFRLSSSRGGSGNTGEGDPVRWYSGFESACIRRGPPGCCIDAEVAGPCDCHVISYHSLKISGVSDFQMGSRASETEARRRTRTRACGPRSWLCIRIERGKQRKEKDEVKCKCFPDADPTKPLPPSFPACLTAG